MNFCGFAGIFQAFFLTIHFGCFESIFWGYLLQVFFFGVYSFLDFNDEANEEEILETCENCDLTEPKTSILIHIGNTKACKAHYGPRFKAMKALNEKEQKQISVLEETSGNQSTKNKTNESIMKVECEFCKKSFSKSSILVHIGKNEPCKSHYGNRFIELKRKKNNEKMQRSRKKLGIEKELKRQRELYAQDSKKKEKKRQYFQEKQSKLASEEGWHYSASNDISEETDQKSNEAYREFEDVNDKRACKYCKKKFSLSTILKHLSHNATCKFSYGNKYQKLERKIIKERKQLAMEKNTENKELIAENIADHPNSRMKIHATQIPEDSVDDLNNDLSISCKFCKRQFLKKSLLRHISRNKSCKAFYGQEFKDMKKINISNRKKQTYKEKMAKEAEERKRLFQEKQKMTQISKEKLKDTTMVPKEKLNQKELDTSNESDEVSCEFCKGTFISSTILKHIAMNKSCKSHYGPKFDEMKKENNRMRMQLYRQRIGSSKEIELYASDPRKKEKKKQYYILNQKKIKDYEKKKYNEVLEQKRAFWHEENKKEKVRFLVDYKKSRDEKVRRHNDCGLKWTQELVQYGNKIIGENNKILKNFEQEIEESHEMFLKNIEEAFECAKDKDDTNTIDKIYLDLLDEPKYIHTIYDFWHDFELKIDVKIIKMAKEIGKKYSGRMACRCNKCQDTFGLKNIMKAKSRFRKEHMLK